MTDAKGPAAMDLSGSPPQTESRIEAMSFGAGDTAEVDFSTNTYDVITGRGKYQLGYQLGEGGFGKVWQATSDRKDAPEVAIKEVEPTPLNLFELDILRTVQAVGGHRNVLELVDGGSSDTKLFIILPLLGGTVHEAIKGTFPLNDAPPHPRTRERWIRETASGLQFLFDLGFIQTDLKPDNVLLRELEKPLDPADVKYESDGQAAWGRYEAVIADFGLALYAPRGWTMSRAISPLPYRPPEMIKLPDREWRRVDWTTLAWNLGVYAYTVLRGRLPFIGKTPESIAGLQAGYLGRSDQWLAQLETTPAFRTTIKQLLRESPRSRAALSALSGQEGRPLYNELPWSLGPEALTPDQQATVVKMARRADDLDAPVPPTKYLAADFYYRYADQVTEKNAEDFYRLPLRESGYQLKDMNLVALVAEADGPVYFRPNFFSEALTDRELLEVTFERINDPIAWADTDPREGWTKAKSTDSTAILEGRQDMKLFPK